MQQDSKYRLYKKDFLSILYLHLINHWFHAFNGKWKCLLQELCCIVVVENKILKQFNFKWTYEKENDV